MQIFQQKKVVLKGYFLLIFQQIDLQPANQNTYDDLIRLCRGDFKADLVINEVKDQFSMYDKGPLVKELKLIKDEYESSLKLIKPTNNREYKR